MKTLTLTWTKRPRCAAPCINTKGIYIPRPLSSPPRVSINHHRYDCSLDLRQLTWVSVPNVPSMYLTSLQKRTRTRTHRTCIHTRTWIPPSILPQLSCPCRTVWGNGPALPQDVLSPIIWHASTGGDEELSHSIPVTPFWSLTCLHYWNVVLIHLGTQ